MLMRNANGLDHRRICINQPDPPFSLLTTNSRIHKDMRIPALHICTVAGTPTRQNTHSQKRPPFIVNSNVASCRIIHKQHLKLNNILEKEAQQEEHSKESNNHAKSKSIIISNAADADGAGAAIAPVA